MTEGSVVEGGGGVVAAEAGPAAGAAAGATGVAASAAGAGADAAAAAEVVSPGGSAHAKGTESVNKANRNDRDNIVIDYLP